MTEAEYPPFRDRLVEHYSADIAQARGLPADEAAGRRRNRQTNCSPTACTPTGNCCS
jgi:hypothetical protein